MIDIAAPWVIDDPLSDRYPVYTRGNVEEVTPNVITPLQWTGFSGPFTEEAWKRALIEFGAFEADEFRERMQDIQAVIHGYCYINLSVQWVFGVRMPGADPEAMSREYLGARADAPVYEPHAGDEAPHLTVRMGRSVQRIFVDDPNPILLASAESAKQLRDERPHLATLTEAELLERHRRVIERHYVPVVTRHFHLVYASSIVAGALGSVLAALDDPSIGVRLMSGLGGVASAAPADALWALGRRVACSSRLTAEFDAGPGGVVRRLEERPDSDAAAFLAAFADFLNESGSRATSEYEAMPDSWETHPAIPLVLIDRLRLQPQDHDPQVRRGRLAAERTALRSEVRRRLAPEHRDGFDSALSAVERYMPAREQSKTTMVRLLHEARLPMREIARRAVGRGQLSSMQDLTMLTLAEVEGLAADPASRWDLVAERWEWHGRLQALEPPYIVVTGKVLSPDQWSTRQVTTHQVAKPGEVLVGVGACPGTATGPARVVQDPSDAGDLQPGEVLIAPQTDPGWTPLFLSAEAVVVDVGNQLSHAAIISRELGIPCVLAVDGATERIANGTVVTVDGSTGTVTVQ